MHVLILGDAHSYGCGLRAGQLSYVGHLIRQVSRAGQSVQVEVHTPSTTRQLLSTLQQLPLQQYDLILVQTECIADELTAPTVWPNLTWPGLSWPDCLSASLTEVLAWLRPFRHTVVLLTPLPHRSRISRHRRSRLRALLMRKADRQLFSLFDTGALLLPRPEYFLDGDLCQLNAVSHELLGRSLFAFYQSAPTIITVRPTRRG